MRATTRLRTMLDAPGIIVAPGAYDGFSARLIEAAGFQAVYMTGAGTAASHLGQPDLGLATLTEMATHASHLASCVSIPLIADADTGYGNALNVVRTVREYEKAGGHYSWWSPMSDVRARNIGWRIDYFLISTAFRPRLKREMLRSCSA